VKSAFIEEFGPPNVIQYGELPIPEVGPQDVLVKVSAVTVDPIDTYIRSGSIQTHPKFPFIIGRDMTGQVVEAGHNVTRFREGQWVWANNQGYAGRQGTFSEYCLIQEDLLYPLPAGADPCETVAVVHSALTAVLGLQFKAGLRWGETLFVNGGDGNVGTAVLQLAKNLGAKVAVTSANEEKARWCKELGADAVINYKTEDVTQAVHKFAPNGVDVYWDATVQPDARRAVDTVARRGRIIFMAGRSHETVLPVGSFYIRNCTLFGFTVTDATSEELAIYASNIIKWLALKHLRAKVACRLPLSDAAKAHHLIESASLFGKVVLQP
jgi:NADPH2:quinone reductase